MNPKAARLSVSRPGIGCDAIKNIIVVTNETDTNADMTNNGKTTLA
jgi:hypothetical protein